MQSQKQHYTIHYTQFGSYMHFRHVSANVYCAWPVQPSRGGAYDTSNLPGPGKSWGIPHRPGRAGGYLPGAPDWSPPHTAPRLRTAPIAGRCSLGRPDERPVKAGEPFVRPALQLARVSPVGLLRLHSLPVSRWICLLTLRSSTLSCCVFSTSSSVARMLRAWTAYFLPSTSVSSF